MKIGFFEIEGWERNAFKQLEGEHEVTYTDEKLSLENVNEHVDLEVISTFIYSELNREILSKLPELKMIAPRATGVDNIAIDYCQERLIQVSNVPDYGQNTVAEHAFALLLTISHHIYESIERTRKGDFTAQGLRGFDLQGKTLGVIGTGSIGRNVVRIGLGFGMKILAFDTRRAENLDGVVNFSYVSMDELLGQADIITLHIPSTAKTKNLLSEAEFGKMKEGVIILNTARGDLINVEALVKALATGKVGGAGLDVLVEEPAIREEAEVLRSFYQHKHNLENLLADHVLLRLRNVFVTPHNAFNTREAVGRILQTTLSNIQTFFESRSTKAA